MKLTELSIRTLRPPAKGAKIYHDDLVSGFGVRVTANDVKSFVLTHGPMRTRETIGRVGVVGLQDARNEGKRRLAEYTLGKHKTRSISWTSAVDLYLTRAKKRLKPRTHADYTRLLTRHFRFGETKVCDITGAMIQAKLDRLWETPAEQQHGFVVLRAFIRWAYRANYIERNPMDRMEQPKGYFARERVLTDDELRRVWNALDDTSFGSIARLLILTGQREGEITRLTREMVNGDLITFPSELTKNKREHQFPVGSMALQLLPEKSGVLLFPRRGSDKPFCGWSKCKATLDQLSGVSEWRLHDLRRTFRTKWEELGISPAVAERYINHVSGEHAGIRRVYNRYNYLKEMREAVALWEGWLQTLIAHGRQPTGHRDVSDNGGRDAALIEEASARNDLVLSGSHCPSGEGWEVPKADTTRPRPGGLA